MTKSKGEHTKKMKITFLSAVGGTSLLAKIIFNSAVFGNSKLGPGKTSVFQGPFF